MSSLPPSASSASVRNILTLLASREAQLVAGAGGLERRVTWASRMRARLPAFESIQGGELALLTLSQLRRLDETLPHLLKTLHTAGVVAVAVAAQSPEALVTDARKIADQFHFPLIWLPSSALLEEIEREVITFVVNFRSEIERKATEIAHQLMRLSVQGAGIEGVCEYLANSRGKWVVVQDADQHIHFQAAPAQAGLLQISTSFNDEDLRQQGLIRVTEPILIRHEVVGYLSLIGNESDFDFLERIILGQIAPILAIEVARQRERSEVESRYLVEAFTDVIQGHYQQPEEMLARARLLGYDLTLPQVVALFEIAPGVGDESIDQPLFQWGKYVREELLRAWPSGWVLSETRRVVALLPAEGDVENGMFLRLERVFTRLLQGVRGGTLLQYSGGVGRVSKNLQSIPLSYREAQQALEIGRRLFGENKLNSFAHLGVYRLLFYLDGQSELTDFYQETLGPLLEHDARNDGTLVETLEGFFRCNGNISETARVLHFHRNSLLYRLTRIEELLGHSLEDSELRLSLQIALKIHHLRKH